MTQNFIDQAMLDAPHPSGHDVLSGKFYIVSTRQEKDNVGDLIGSLPLLVFAIEDAIDETVVQFDGSNRPIAIDGSITFLGAIALSKESRSIFKKFEAHLQLMCNNHADIFYTEEKKKEDININFRNWVIEKLIQEKVKLIKDNKIVRSALVTLRREHEDTLEKFSMLENSVSYYGTPRIIERIYLRPTSDTIELGASELNNLRQIIPVQTLGLSGIEIYLEDKLNNAVGVLQVSLIDEDSGMIYDRWTVRSENLVSGKNIFLLEKALSYRNRDPVVDILWSGNIPVRILLSSPNPIPLFCAILGNSKRLDAPIAIRALASIPGSSISPHQQEGTRSQKETFDKISNFTYALGSNELQNATQLYPSTSSIPWNPVEFRSTYSDILVHPLNDDITIAIIKNVNIRNIKYLSALVLLDHSSANPVECSLGAIRSGSKIAEPHLLPKIWTRVEPNMLTEVGGTIDLQGDDKFDIFLASRMCDGASSDLAWAFFKRIEVTV